MFAFRRNAGNINFIYSPYFENLANTDTKNPQKSKPTLNIISPQPDESLLKNQSKSCKIKKVKSEKPFNHRLLRSRQSLKSERLEKLKKVEKIKTYGSLKSSHVGPIKYL